MVAGGAGNNVFFSEVITGGQHTKDAAAGGFHGVITGTDALVHGAAQEDHNVHKNEPGDCTDEGVTGVVGGYQRRVNTCVIERDHADIIRSVTANSGVRASTSTCSVAVLSIGGGVIPPIAAGGVAATAVIAFNIFNVFGGGV